MRNWKDPVLEEDLQRLAGANLPYDTWKNRTFLITGATGLIGSLAVKALLHISDVHSLQLQIVAQVRNPQKAAQVFGPLLDRKDLSLLPADLSTDRLEYPGCIDYIIHAAASTTSKFLVSNPVEASKTALNGTLSVLELAASKPIRGMVYLSSMEVYGVLTDSRDIHEEDLGYVDLQAVRSCYPEGKRMCECLCAAYAKEYAVPVCSLRLAQTFGAGVSWEDNRVFAQFAKSVMAGVDIVLHTDGSSEGNYIYTTDALKAMFLLLDKGAHGQAYNAVNEQCHTTILGMANMVAQQVANGQIKVVISLPEDASAMGYAPKTKLRLMADKLRALGWYPEIDLKEAYQRLINSLEGTIGNYEQH